MAAKNEIEKKLEMAFKQAKDSGMSQEEIDKCTQQFYKDLYSRYNSQKSSKFSFILWFLWLCLYRLLPLGLILMFTLQKVNLIYSSDPCLIAQPVLSEFAMPIVNCTRCSDIKGPVIIHDITPKEFMETYAFTLQPLLMKGAALNWSAINVFSYQYFKDLYTQRPDAIDHDVTEGQFFPYSSGIHRLDEFMSLDNKTATLQGQRWYIGWSTSEPFIGEELRKHLSPPYFLPPKSSDNSLAWIFMGAPGPGASLHIDWVGLPSWQAQLSGRKTWTLAPPPECEGVCSIFNVTVERGDIIVVDTNAWFHATYIHPGNISITYGAEYQ